MSEKPKHGGCAFCGSTTDPILVSGVIGFAQSKAVCSRLECREKVDLLPDHRASHKVVAS